MSIPKSNLFSMFVIQTIIKNINVCITNGFSCKPSDKMELCTFVNKYLCNMTENQTFYKNLGSRIKTARKRVLLTQESLAEKVSLTRTTVTNIEKGRQQLLVHTLVDIAKVLNVSVEVLIPSQQTTSINDLINVKVDSPEAQEFIRKAYDMADRD